MRSIVSYEDWTITPDREPDAEPTTYEMVCCVCGDGSANAEDWQAPQDWALRHSGRNPSHHTYREVITRPWRTWMRR